MSSTPPLPRRKVPRDDSTRKALQPTSNREDHRAQRKLRLRADSAGSTRGAFFHNMTAEEVEETMGHKHPPHHPPPPPSKQQQNYQSMTSDDEPILHGEMLDHMYQPRPAPSVRIASSTTSASETSMVYSSVGSIRTEDPMGGTYDTLNYSETYSMRTSILPPLEGNLADLEANAQSSRLKSWLEGSGKQPYESQQQEEIAQFSSMANYGSTTPKGEGSLPPPPPPQSMPMQYEEETKTPQESILMALWTKLLHLLDPTDWLLADLQYDEDGIPYFEEGSDYTLAGLVRWMLYNPEYPEFTSLQQINWAVIIGVFMGFYTAIWKRFIHACMNFLWITVPTKLLQWGVFTGVNGYFPLPHYMWIIPTIFGGLLSYIMVIVPKAIPGQNEYLKTLHARGIQSHDTFWPIFFIATAGMASGLSLGPELPLILTGGMVGSFLGLITKQSILQARVLNLTAAGAAIGGFFGFPMAGAMFVLELPHRMGLQYFEALSPATIASIVAVLVNRMVTGNNVTGYYQYPFLTNTLPSGIFSNAIVMGLVGGGLGIVYAKGVMKIKGWVHDLFHHRHDGHGHEERPKPPSTPSPSMNGHGEVTPLVNPSSMHTVKEKPGFFDGIAAFTQKVLSFGIKDEARRMAVVGSLAGFVTGIICMFVPHILFWGEQQLQSLIDKGRTPLPVFGQGNSPTADLTAYGYCLIDPNNAQQVARGYSIGCEAVITVAKIVVTGLCLGTGIVGGHFWGPLFVGVIASHLFTDVVRVVTTAVGFGQTLIAYPCVTILCFMGSTHVVTFRAHLAIMLILTLTISAFNPLNSVSGNTSGDYSAVFPLLVVSVFVSLMISRNIVFYKEQRSRGDIMALPEALCEPGKEGAPMVVHYGGAGDDDGEGDGIFLDDDDDDDENEPFPDLGGDLNITAETIERDFHEASIMHQAALHSPAAKPPTPPNYSPRQLDKPSKIARQSSWSGGDPTRYSTPKDRLDELLSQPMDSTVTPTRGTTTTTTRSHRRIQSASAAEAGGASIRMKQIDTLERHSRSGSGGSEITERLVRVNTYGEVSGMTPSLMDQARRRASSLHRRIPSLPKSHSRKNSDSSAAALTTGSGADPLSMAEIAAGLTNRNSFDSGSGLV